MKKSILLYCFSLLILHAHAQWQQTNGPLGGYVSTITSEGTDVYMISENDYNDKVFHSADNGHSWAYLNAFTGHNLWSIAVMGSMVFAGTSDEGIFRSMDNGLSWTRVNNGLIYKNKSVNSITHLGSILYAGMDDGVYMSRDSGRVWINVTNNLKQTYVMSLTGSGTDIYASTYGGLSRSTDTGRTWQFIWDMEVWSPQASLSSFTADSNRLVVGTLGGGVFYSNDFGKSWKKSITIFYEVSITALVVKGNTILAGGGYNDGSIYVSNNFGQSWNRYELGLVNTEINALAISGPDILAGTDGGMYFSGDGAFTWNPVNTGLLIQTMSTIIPVDNGIMSGTYTNGMYHSTDLGQNWKQINNGLGSKLIYAMATDGMTVYCGTDDGMYISRDMGKSWLSRRSGSPYIWEPYSIVIQGSKIYAGTAERIIIVSDDSGETWRQLNNEVAFPASEWSPIVALLVEDSVILAGGGSFGIFVSFDNGLSWTNSLNFPNVLGYGVYAFQRINNRIVAATTEGIYVSDDSGRSWSSSNTGMSRGTEVYCLFRYHDFIYAGTEYGVFRSDDQGKSWKNESQGLDYNTAVAGLTLKDNYLYAAVYNSSVWRRPLSEVVAVENTEISSSSLVYPNPSDGIFQISGNEHFESIEVYNIRGKLVFSKYDFDKYQSNQINLSHLSSGIYSLKAMKHDKISSEKIVIEK